MVETRRAQPEDIAAIVPLWLSLMREHEARDPRFRLAGDPAEAYAEGLANVMQNPDAVVYLATLEGAPAGYLIALVLANPSFFEVERYGFIAEMAVAPEHRRSGVGKELWSRAKRWFLRKGVKVAQLNVSPLNEPGLAFWNSVGFRDFLTIQWCNLEEREAE
jgi:ribosomal protein S18 acetylase RimI-like enzyme